MESIYEMLSSLSDTNKKWLADHLYQDISDTKVTAKSNMVSDEELAARLSKFPSWEEVDHADLSSVDYAQYKPFASFKSQIVSQSRLSELSPPGDKCLTNSRLL